MKVLLVDDDPDAVLLATFVLEAAGWEVVSAKCGLEALEKVAHELPDVVLLDFLLPDVDGGEVLRRLRQHPQSAQTPVIFLTGKEQPEGVEELRCQGVLRKPFDPEKLAQEVGRLLERNREPATGGA